MSPFLCRGLEFDMVRLGERLRFVVGLHGGKVNVRVAL